MRFSYPYIFIVIGLLVSACMKDPRVDLNANEDSILFISSPSSSARIFYDYDFGEIYSNQEKTMVFTLKNQAKLIATDLSFSKFPAGITFTGGSFPGTGGTCKTDIYPGASCTLALTYAPALGTSLQDEIRLNYLTNHNQNKKSLSVLTLKGNDKYLTTQEVSTVSPLVGSIYGNTFVTLTGPFFHPFSTVQLGGASCNGISVSADSKTLTCTSTSRVAGLVDVVVTSPVAKVGTLPAAYRYHDIPFLTSISPIAGAIAGGTLLTLTGSSFVAGATITVGGLTCTSPTVVSPTQATCITPANSNGARDVTFRNADTYSATLTNAYTYQPAPTVTSVNIPGGPLAGGTALTITGTNFMSAATVTVGGVTCTSPVVVNSTTITCTNGAHAAATVNIVVTNWDNQFGTGTNLYTYRPAPTVTNVSPAGGALAGGTSVTITGTGFIAAPSVVIGGNPCTSVVVNSSTSITCTTAAHAAGVTSVVITNTDNQFGTGTNLYTYQPAPTVSSVSPIAGALGGGTAITLTGTNFLSPATVTVGGVTCTSPTVVNSTTITCTTGAHAAATTSIIVTNWDNQTGTGTNLYTYQPAPTVTSVSPNGGLPAGGTSITITGTNFLSPATVTVGGVTCTSPTVVNSTTITCTTGAHAAATTSIIVTNWDNQTGTGTNLYTYRPAPTVTSVSLNGGALAGGTNITVTGTGFVTGATVTVGGVTCTSPNVTNSTTLTCTTGAHAAGVTSIVVTNTDTQFGTGTNLYTYQPAPTVSSVTPTGGALAGGTALTITGTNFLSPATVTVGGVTCTSPTVVNSTTITCTTGAHAAAVTDIVVTNWDQQTGTGTNLYTYRPAPTVTSVSLNAGALAGGTNITITGTGFVAAATVTVGGVTCTSPNVTNSTTITCTTGAHAAGVTSIIVTNADTQNGTGTNLYTYQAAPTVTSVSPTAGALGGGTSITLTGTGFLSAPTVLVGGSSCTSIVVNSSTSITCTTPAHAAGVTSIVVTNTDTQFGTGTNLYTFQAAPTVTSVNLNAGALAGGTSITITGTGFLSGATATVGGVTCTTPNVSNATTMTCTTGAHAAGVTSIIVTNSDTQTGTGTNLYTYQAAPTVTIASPSAGALAGGTSISITGTGFVTAATVTVGGVACTSPNVTNSTTMTCTTGAHAAGLTNIIVTNADTQSGTGTNLYTYQAAPTVSSVSPSTGPTTGGTALTITGTGFLSGATAQVAGNTCTSPSVSNSTTFLCTSPAGSAGLVNVTVTNTDNQTGTGTNVYTYYTPDSWTATTTTGAPAARYYHSALWANSKMIVFGGWNGTTYFNDGGQFDPTANSWSLLATLSAPAGRYAHTAVWSNSKMIIFGGTNAGNLNTGGQYDPVGNTWTATSTVGAPSQRAYHTAIASSSKMVVFGGFGGTYLNDGGQYDPSANTWTATSTNGAPATRRYHTAIWTTSKMVVFGGTNASNLNDGGQYDPTANTWTAISTNGAPAIRNLHSTVWNTSKMLVFGGLNTLYLNSGGQYDPTGNSWTTMSTNGAPALRNEHTAIWSTDRMIVFGGWDGTNRLNSGGSYDPTGNTWTGVSTTNIPGIREFHTGVWTGAKMIIWGGRSGAASYVSDGGVYQP